MWRIAPSSGSFTCIGVDNVRAYSYFRTTRGDASARRSPRWAFELADVLPREQQRMLCCRPCVLHPSELGPLFERADPEGRVLIVVLVSNGVTRGVAGLERTSAEPGFSRRELDEIGALAGALSLAAGYALAVELFAYEEAAMRGHDTRSALSMLADTDARQIIWASSTEQPLNWQRDVLPLQRLLFETGSAGGSVAAAKAVAVEIHELDLDTARYSVVRVPGTATLSLSRREREVAQLLIGGYANLNIAAHLGISENTIRTYIRRLYKKLNVCNRIDLIRTYRAAT